MEIPDRAVVASVGRYTKNQRSCIIHRHPLIGWLPFDPTVTTGGPLGISHIGRLSRQPLDESTEQANEVISARR
jgi:hypothetical protein